MHSRNKYAADSQHAHQQRMQSQKVPHAMMERAKERHRVGQEVAARLTGRKKMGWTDIPGTATDQVMSDSTFDAFFYNYLTQTVRRCAKSRTSGR